MSPEVGSVIGGKYRLYKPLARGGMGSIWVARHAELDVSVAIKLIAPELVASDSAVHRFRHEARAAAQLRSPHVVQILDYGVDAGLPYMAMELLSGEDLGALLERQGRLGLERVLELLRPVCKALKLAHEARIVHRDLKPANIYVAKVGDDEVVKVLDFGIAKALGGDGSMKHTASATLVGSPLYMSPEQSRGDPVDARSDLWALGVVAFEALVGRPPFEGRGLGDIFAQICHAPTPKPSELGVAIPGIDAFFARSLAKSPADRQASVSEWLAELEACLSDAKSGRSAGTDPGAKASLAPAPPARALTAVELDTLSSSETSAAVATGDRPSRRLPAVLLVGAPLLVFAGIGAFYLRGSLGGSTTPEPEASSAASADARGELAGRAEPGPPVDGELVVSPAGPAVSAQASSSAQAPSAVASVDPAPQASAPATPREAPRQGATSATTARAPRSATPPASAAPPPVRVPSTTDPVFGIPGGP